MRHAHEYEAGLAETVGRRRRGRRNGVLALQQAAGNRAVGEILARQPGVTAPAKADESAKTGARTSHVVVPGIGTIELESFNWGQGPAHGGGPGQASFTDINLTTKHGKHSAELQLAVAEGRYFKQIEIVHYSPSGAGIRLTLTDVVLTSYSVGQGGRDGPLESWSVSFTSVKHEYIRPDDE